MTVEIDAAVVQATAGDAHEQQVAMLQLLIRPQLTKSGFGPAVIKVGLQLELLSGAAAFPVPQHDALLSVPIPSQGPAVMHRPDPLPADQRCFVATWLAITPLLGQWINDVPGEP